MGLGGINTISLADARRDAECCRKLLLSGADPIESKKSERAAKAAEHTVEVRTFRWCSEKYISVHSAGWQNLKHSKQWAATLERYAYPVIGDTSIAVIDTAHVLEILEPIWVEKPETASRVRGRIEAVIDWASARGLRKGENPARWRGHLNKLLPARSRVRKVQHLPAMPYDDVPRFVRALRCRDAIAAAGFEFLILTASRTSEVIGASWDEIDEQARVWTVPAERMKAGKAHRVPICDAAMFIIEKMKAARSSKYVFSGAKHEAPLSNMAFLALRDRMGLSGFTPHGFRSSFRDWAAEKTRYPSEVAEMALAHTIPSAVEAAYRRGDLFERRRALMADWAAFLEADTTGTVVRLSNA